MEKRYFRDCLKCVWAIIFFGCISLILYFCKKKLRKVINSDLERRNGKSNLELPNLLKFLYYIHNDRFYRNLFYHRVGPIISLFISCLSPGDKYFVISSTTKVGKGAYFAHPFSSIINAKSIGENFSCSHSTTLGNKIDGNNENRPTIGDNVSLGANVVIIGGVKIGNNVTIGAGSVVVKDIPDNSVAVGNPAKVIKTLPPIE